MIKLTQKERQFCDLYAKYGGNYNLIMRDMRLKHSGYEAYMRRPAVREYLSCAM